MLFVLAQGLIFNHINIAGYVSPLVYVMFILLLPFDTPRSLTLVIAFFLGYFTDLFSGTPGMHAAATVFIAFLRPFLINAVTRDVDEDVEQKPTIKSMGLRRVFIFTTYMVIIHHTLYFFIESFRLSEFWQTLMRSAFSSAATIILIIFLQLIFFSRSGSSRKFS